MPSVIGIKKGRQEPPILGACKQYAGCYMLDSPDVFPDRVPYLGISIDNSQHSFRI